MLNNFDFLKINLSKKIIKYFIIFLSLFIVFIFSGCDDEVRLKEINISSTPEIVQVGDSFTIDVSFSPENATDTKISWETPTPALVGVESGTNFAIITAKAVGQAVVIIRARDGGFTKTCAFEITSSEYSLTFGTPNEVITREYNNTPQSVEVLGAPESVDVVYTYKLIGSNEVATTTPPTDAGTYQITASINTPNHKGFVAGTLIIKPMHIVITAFDANKYYGDSDDPSIFSKRITSGKLHEGISYSGTLKREAGEVVGTYAIVQDQPYTLYGEKKDNYTISFVPGEFTIFPRPLNIVIDNKVSAYGNALEELTYTASNFAFNDDESIIKGDLYTANPLKNAGTYNILCNLNAPNYQIVATKATYTITPIEVTVFADDQTMIFGQSFPSFTYEIYNEHSTDTSKLLFDDTFEGSLSPTKNARNVGEYKIGIGTLKNQNYIISIKTGTLTISPRPITIVLTSGIEKYYGNEDPDTFSFETTQESLELVDEYDKLTLKLIRSKGENIGTYDISVDPLIFGNNYNVSLAPGQSFVINERPLKVNFADLYYTYGDETHPVEYEIIGSLGFVDEFKVEFDYGDMLYHAGQSAILDENNIHIYNKENIDVTTNYDLQVCSGKISVAKKELTVVIASGGHTYGDKDNTLLTSTLRGLLTRDKLSLTREEGTSVGQYRIYVKNYDELNENYEINLISAIYTISKREVTVKIPKFTQIYGDSPVELNYTISSSSLAYNDTLNLTREVGENVGVYEINILDDEISKNYDITVTGDAKYEITPRSITIVLTSGINKTYGDADPITFTWDYAPQSLETVDDEDLNGHFEREIGENIGNYKIKLGTLSFGSNYEITIQNPIFTIAKRPLVVKILDAEIEYGDVSAIIQYELQNTLAIGDYETVEISLENLISTPGAHENVGYSNIVIQNSNKIDVTENYDISCETATIIVNKRNLKIIIDNKTQVYGDETIPLTYTQNGLVEGDIISLSCQNNLNAGVYDILLANTDELSINYNIDITLGTYTISKRPITIFIKSVEQIYGEEEKPLEFEVVAGSLVSGESLTLVRQEGEEIGEYPITLVDDDISKNYEITISNNDTPIYKIYCENLIN